MTNPKKAACNRVYNRLQPSFVPLPPTKELIKHTPENVSLVLGSHPYLSRNSRFWYGTGRYRARKYKAGSDLLKRQEEAKRQADALRPVVKTETKTETIPFESTEQNSATLAQGRKQVSTQGVNGERTITYEVTYVQGKETARKEIKNEVTKQPVTKVTLVGTYVAPAPATTSTPTTQTSSGARTGAICNDGSSSTATGRGACSHHGGVAYWLYG